MAPVEYHCDNDRSVVGAGGHATVRDSTMKRIAIATTCAVPIVALSLVLCSCDPMYRFKFTKFAFVSDEVAGNPTKVEHVKEGDLSTVVGTRDGISVKPIGGRNMMNTISLVVSVKNDTDESLLLDPTDLVLRTTYTPLNLVSKVSGGSRCQIPTVTVNPAMENDGIFTIDPKTEAIVEANFGLFGASKCWFELKLRPQSSEEKITFRFKGVPGGSAF